MFSKQELLGHMKELIEAEMAKEKLTVNAIAAKWGIDRKAVARVIRLKAFPFTANLNKILAHITLSDDEVKAFRMHAEQSDKRSNFCEQRAKKARAAQAAESGAIKPGAAPETSAAQQQKEVPRKVTARVTAVDLVDIPLGTILDQIADRLSERLALAQTKPCDQIEVDPKMLHPFLRSAEVFRVRQFDLSEEALKDTQELMEELGERIALVMETESLETRRRFVSALVGLMDGIYYTLSHAGLNIPFNSLETYEMAMRASKLVKDEDKGKLEIKATGGK